MSKNAENLRLFFCITVVQLEVKTKTWLQLSKYDPYCLPLVDTYLFNSMYARFEP